MSVLYHWLDTNAMGRAAEGLALVASNGRVPIRFDLEQREAMKNRDRLPFFEQLSKQGSGLKVVVASSFPSFASVLVSIGITCAMK